MVDQARPDSRERDRRDLERRLVALERRPAFAVPDPVSVSFDPVWTNFTIGTDGSAQNIGDFTIISAREMRLNVRAVLGSTGSSVGTGVSLALPTGWRLRKIALASIPLYGLARLVVGGAERDLGLIEPDGASLTSLRIRTATRTAISATAPATWAPGDVIEFSVLLPVEPV